MNTKDALYRVALTILALVLVIWVVPVGARAQWLHLKTPGIPRSADGKPNLTAPAPRTAEGKPDLSGLWNNLGEKSARARRGRD